MTGISCQRCQRPICGECMNPASVGFQCPSCVTSGRGTVRAPRTRFGAILKPGGGNATKVMMGVLAGVWVLNLVSGGLLDRLLVMSNEAIYFGQFWRLITASLTSGSILGVLLNVLVLWIAGRAIESELGAWRFVALYLAAGLGGTTMLFLFGPSESIDARRNRAVLSAAGSDPRADPRAGVDRLPAAAAVRRSHQDLGDRLSRES